MLVSVPLGTAGPTEAAAAQCEWTGGSPPAGGTSDAGSGIGPGLASLGADAGASKRSGGGPGTAASKRSGGGSVTAVSAGGFELLPMRLDHLLGDVAGDVLVVVQRGRERATTLGE